jgi:hypothetical protein
MSREEEESEEYESSLATPNFTLINAEVLSAAVQEIFIMLAQPEIHY